MRVPYLSLLAILGLYVLVTAPDTRAPLAGLLPSEASTPNHAAAAPSHEAARALPDRALTPGAVLTVDLAKICMPGFGKAASRTSRALKLAVYAAYRLAPDSTRYEIDHLIPLELGGADIAQNLWPQSYRADGVDAGAKDRLENFLHRQVCAGKIPLRVAQAEIAGDWLAAYRKYLGRP